MKKNRKDSKIKKVFEHIQSYRLKKQIENEEEDKRVLYWAVSEEVDLLIENDSIKYFSDLVVHYLKNNITGPGTIRIKLADKDKLYSINDFFPYVKEN